MIITLLFPHNYCSFLLANNFMMRIAVPRIGCKIPRYLQQIQSQIIFIQNSESVVGISSGNRQESNTLHKLVSAHLGLDGPSLLIDYRDLFILKKRVQFAWKPPFYHLLSNPQTSAFSCSGSAS